MRALVLAIVLFAGSARADQGADTSEAGKRFAAGVTLYNEADYRAALVEFKRAYDIAPNPAVLYNIGQTHYQLQNYAAAYLTLTRYIAEAGADAAHKDEVNDTLRTLQSRIGKIDVMTNVPGADVRIDDELVGKTPLPAPVLISVGRHKVEVSLAGREPQSRIIDVAAGDTFRQEIVLAEPKKDTPIAPPVTVAPVEKHESSKAVPALWVTSGALAIGAVVTGIVAYRAEDRLDTLKGQFPVSASALDHQAHKVKLYSGIADGVGAAAIVTAGVALTATILRRGSSKESSTKVGILPGRVVIGRNF